MFCSWALINFWFLNFMFRVNCIVTDGKDITNFLLSGKPSEKFFKASTHHFLYDKNFTDPYVVPPQMLEVLNKLKIFQLRSKAYRSALNKCDIYDRNVFDDFSKETLIKLTRQAEIKPSNT